jgi:cell division septation protein DedD
LFDLDDPQAVGAQLITVVQGLYTDMRNDEQGNTLLHAMAQRLRELDDPMATNVATEIEQWLQGRTYHAQGEYQQAVTAYDVAIRLNDRNPGAYFDRGRAYAELEDYDMALVDFEQIINLNEEWQPKVREVVEGDSELFGYHGIHKDQFPGLSFLPTLTPTPTSADTPTSTPTHASVPTSTPTSTPTATSTPTGTPTPTSTSTNTPPPRIITPELQEPLQGSTHKSPVTFRWSGSLSAGQAYQVAAWHIESGHVIQSGSLAGQSWTADLPGDKFGEWHWRVSVVSGGSEPVTSPKGMFWFNPFPSSPLATPPNP